MVDHVLNKKKLVSSEEKLRFLVKFCLILKVEVLDTASLAKYCMLG
jgi:hypothetical protein